MKIGIILLPLVIAPIFFLGTPVIASGWNFTFETVNHTPEEGFPYSELRFKGPENNMGFILPEGWVATGGGDRLVFNPAGRAQVRYEIQAIPGAGTHNFDDEQVVEAHRKWVVSIVPPEAQEISIVEENRDFFPVTTFNKYQFIIGYSLFGSSYRRSIFLLHDKHENQLRFITTAPEAEFAEFHEEVRRAMFGWGAVD
ncbi:MAG: hypothetical protein ACFCU3_07495 [Verrucomicrobiales bacterium]